MIKEISVEKNEFGIDIGIRRCGHRCRRACRGRCSRRCGRF